MKRDRIIAISERVACEVPTPIDLGALRSADSEISWREEATLAVAKGERVVLSGDISNFAKLVATITEILLETPRARFALLIHAMQARASGPPNAALSLFESI